MGSLKMFLDVNAAATLILMSHAGCSVDAYNILFFTMIGSSSHAETFLPAMEALSLRGHNVSYLTEVPMKSAKMMPNVTVHHMVSLHEFLVSHRVHTFDVNLKITDGEQVTKMLTIMTVDACRVFLNDPSFRAVIEDKSVRYDVVVVDPVLVECGLALMHLLVGRPPFIFYCTTHLYPWTSTSMDIPTPLSYVPMSIMSRSSLHSSYSNNFMERFSNAYDFFQLEFARIHLLMPAILEIVRSIYPTTPALLQIEKNVSFVFTNSHPASLDIRRPLTNYFAEVGGTHLHPARPLPKDLEKFVNGSGKHGFIYVSFGTYISDAEMIADRVNAFVGAFRKLKQRVVWRTKRLNITNLSPNVRIFPWVPQQDLLGHPKIKAFISQCGQLSVQEAVYHGVPIVGMPIVADQSVNVGNVLEKGIGETLDYHTFDERMLHKTLRKIISNTSYKKNCRRVSSLMRDRPSRAIDTITYWVEYIARHKGAPNLRNKEHQGADFISRDFSLNMIAAVIVCFAVVCLTKFGFAMPVARKASHAFLWHH